MIPFTYYNPVRLIFGNGTFGRLGALVATLGRRALLVTGRSAARSHGYLDRAVTLLGAAGIEAVVFDAVPPNPTDDIADAGGELARQQGCEVVIGLGGGSAMDAAKGIAVAATHNAPIRRFVVADATGAKLEPTAATLPIVCVTTTSGTSSELTPFAVITVPEGPEKSAIGHDLLFPRIAICDPELTYSVPERVTASTGVDVLCHAMEGYISTAAGPFTDHAAEEAIRLVGQYLPRAVERGDDAEARYQMALANVFAGVALSNCGATIIHALEHPVSAHYPAVPHGEGLAALLIAYARVCGPALPDKFARVSALLGGAHDAAAAAETFQRLLERVGMNVRLSQLGVQREMLATLADDALRYMLKPLEKTPGCADRECLLRILEESY